MIRSSSWPIRLALVLALGLLPGTSALAGEMEAALGLSGEVYVVQNGPCGELFDDCGEGEAAWPVLALDVLRQGQAPARLLVPGTEGEEVEGTPALLFEDASASLFLVYETKLQPAHSQVNLGWLHDGTWSEVIEVSGDIYPLKGPPQIAITRDTFELQGAATEPASHQRTLLHVTWWEVGPSAEQVFYTPIVLLDGAYLGRNQVYDLSSLDPAPLPSPAPTVPAELCRAPVTAPGATDWSVVTGFVNPRTGRLLSFTVEVLPVELVQLCDRVEPAILQALAAVGAADRQQLAERIRMHLVEIGVRFHPGFLGYAMDEIERSILAATEADFQDVPTLAERIRMHLVEIGARTLATGGVLRGSGSAQVDQLLEVQALPGGAPAGAETHLFWLRLASSLPAPVVGSGPLSIYLSADGAKALVSWQSEEAILYRESQVGGWSEVRSLSLGALEPGRADGILRRRVRER